MRHALALPLVLSACVPPGPDPVDPDCPSLVGGRSAGIVAADGLVEASGLVASRAHPGVLWAHNDSGDVARVFAIGDDGADLGDHKVTAAAALDWEDVGLVEDGDGWSLLVGDIGDNEAALPDVVVWRFPEPDPDEPGPTASAEALHWRYPDGPHDAETLLVDPRTGDVLLVTKGGAGPHAYVARAPLADDVDLEDGGALVFPDGVDPLATIATGGDVSADGARVIVRSHDTAWVWTRADGASIADALTTVPCVVPLAADEQHGEAIAWTPSGDAYLTVGEGLHPTLWRFGPL